jgi:glucan phosphoethanolaminetransferase (alkaline phosphatase superfamily)
MNNIISYGGKKKSKLEKIKFPSKKSSFLNNESFVSKLTFFLKPTWIILVFSSLLALYYYLLISNRKVNYNDKDEISKFNASHIGFLIGILIIFVLSIIKKIPILPTPVSIILLIVLILGWISIFIALFVLIYKAYEDKNTNYDLTELCKNVPR